MDEPLISTIAYMFWEHIGAACWVKVKQLLDSARLDYNTVVHSVG